MPETAEQTTLLDALTSKQREVIAFVSEGLTSKEIARKINISENSYELVKDEFECSYRGELTAKNKGAMKADKKTQK